MKLFYCNKKIASINYNNPNEFCIFFVGWGGGGEDVTKPTDTFEKTFY